MLSTLRSIFLVLVVILSACTDRKADFTTEVKPILNKHCITCHGGVKQKGGFSLLFREEALANTKSGKPAIIPGDPEGSEMMRRINNKDPEERMPPKGDGLKPEEQKKFRAGWSREREAEVLKLWKERKAAPAAG